MGGLKDEMRRLFKEIDVAQEESDEARLRELLDRTVALREEHGQEYNRLAKEMLSLDLKREAISALSSAFEENLPVAFLGETFRRERRQSYALKDMSGVIQSGRAKAKARSMCYSWFQEHRKKYLMIRFKFDDSLVDLVSRTQDLLCEVEDEAIQRCCSFLEARAKDAQSDGDRSMEDACYQLIQTLKEVMGVSP